MSDVPAHDQLTRAGIRTPRAAAIAGIAFAVLLTTAMVLLRWATPRNPSASVDWLNDSGRRRAFLLALNLLPFAGIAFLWFIGVVRDRIGEFEDRFFATVFLGSGLLFIAMMFTSGAVAAGLASYASASASPTEIVAFGRRVTLNLLTIYAMRMAAVFTISTTTIASRLQLFPRWLVIFGGVAGLTLLFAVGVVPWTEVIFPVWVFALSVHILIGTMHSTPPGEASIIDL
jgi:hypothetical protein